jgi:hypothetical protein
MLGQQLPERRHAQENGKVLVSTLGVGARIPDFAVLLLPDTA